MDFYLCSQADDHKA